MRIALFSDIHGHITGLKAVLARLNEQGGADQIYALGDIVGGGPGAEDVIDLLLEHNAQMVLGNWDQVFCGLDAHLATLGPGAHESVVKTYEWLTEWLSPSHQKLLADLPMTRTVQLSSKHALFMCHAAPTDNAARICKWDAPAESLQGAFEDVDANLIAYGHYHAHHIRHLNGKIFLNVAAVGLGWAGLSTLTIVEADEPELRIRQYQVPYDMQEHYHLMAERQVPHSPAIYYW